MSKLTDFKPQRKNSNKHTPRGLSALEQSIQADGWIGAITVAADGETFDGSARIEVGAATGFEDAIVVESDGTRPIVHVRKDIPTADDPRARRLGHAANRVAQMNLDFDPSVILADIEAGVNLDALWRPDELEALVSAASLETAAGEDKGAQVDRAEELGRAWGVQAGQLWEIPSKTVKGKAHRLLMGDCRNPDDVRRLCAEKVQGVFTSPPYAEQRKEQYGGVPVDEYVAWWEAVQANVRDALRPDGSFFVNIKAHCEDGERVLYVMDLVLAMKRRWEWRYIDELCWKKTAFPRDPALFGKFKDGFEPVYQWALSAKYKFHPSNVMHYSKNAGHVTKSNNPSLRHSQGRAMDLGIETFEGEAYPSNVIEANHGNSVTGHAAAFPVALPDFFIRAYSDPGDIWLDPFVGSGTVFVAAEQNKRLAYGMELLEKHGGVILQRLADMGLEPRLLT